MSTNRIRNLTAYVTTIALHSAVKILNENFCVHFVLCAAWYWRCFANVNNIKCMNRKQLIFVCSVHAQLKKRNVYPFCKAAANKFRNEHSPISTQISLFFFPRFSHELRWAVSTEHWALNVVWATAFHEKLWWTRKKRKKRKKRKRRTRKMWIEWANKIPLQVFSYSIIILLYIVVYNIKLNARMLRVYLCRMIYCRSFFFSAVF